MPVAPTEQTQQTQTSIAQQQQAGQTYAGLTSAGIPVGTLGGLPPGSLPWLGWSFAMQQPQLLQGQMAANTLAAQLGVLPSLYAQQQAAMGRGQKFGLGRIDLARQADAIRRAGLGRQLGLLGAESGLAEQLFGLDARLLRETEVATRRRGEAQKKGFSGAAAARGAVSTVGHREGMQEIQSSLQENLSRIHAARGRLDIGRARRKLGEAEQRARLGDAAKMLDLHAKELNLSAAELKARVGAGLAQLGLDQFLKTEDLYLKLFEVQGNQAEIATEILQQALVLGMQFPLGASSGGMPKLGGAPGGAGSAATAYMGGAVP
jgi:hypothetical protein